MPAPLGRVSLVVFDREIGFRRAYWYTPFDGGLMIDNETPNAGENTQSSTPAAEPSTTATETACPAEGEKANAEQKPGTCGC